MHIALCLPNLNGGGAERSTVQIANGLQERGHEVDLVLLQKTGQYVGEISQKVNVVDLGVSRARYAIFPLSRYLKTHRPDIAYSSLLNIPLLLANQFAGGVSKVVLSERSLFSVIREDAKTVSGKISFALSRFFYPLSDAIVAVSHASADDLVRYGVAPLEKVRVIYNPVLSERIFELQKKPPALDWLQRKDAPVVLAAGRLAPEKDYPTLLRAFSSLETKARLIIMGEGGERAQLESLVRELGLEDRVLLPGFVENPYACMAHADVFVLSSRYEGLPGVLIQSMACGLTPVATDCPGGSSEILCRGRCGYLTPVGDASAMASAILKALKNPIPAEELRARANQFSEQASIDAYEKLFMELLNKSIVACA